MPPLSNTLNGCTSTRGTAVRVCGWRRGVTMVRYGDAPDGYALHECGGVDVVVEVKRSTDPFPVLHQTGATVGRLLGLM